MEHLLSIQLDKYETYILSDFVNGSDKMTAILSIIIPILEHWSTGLILTI